MEIDKINQFINDLDEFELFLKNYDKANIFNILGIIHAEIRHSNILSWLINPANEHNLKDYLIKQIINHIDTDSRIDSLDLNDLDVRREWQNIDILAISNKNKLVIAFENKIDSLEHSNQLKRYENIVKSNFKSYKQYFIFLTKENAVPPSYDLWKSLYWSNIHEFISKKYLTIKMKESIKILIKDYLSTIKEFFMKNDELIKKCDEIYFKYKDILDFIFENKSDYSQTIFNFISEQLKNWNKKHDFKIIYWENSIKTYIRFLPKEISDLFVGKGTNSNWNSSMLAFEIENREDKIGIKCTLGPTQLKYKELWNAVLSSAKKSKSFKYKKEIESANINGYPQLNKVWLCSDINKMFKESTNEKDFIENFSKKEWPKIENYIQNTIPILSKELLLIAKNYR